MIVITEFVPGPEHDKMTLTPQSSYELPD